MTYPIILPAVVIDSSNNAIEMTEGLVTETVFVAVGVYFLPDLIDAVLAAMDSQSNAVGPNTYQANAYSDPDPTAPAAAVEFDRATGATAWAMLWSHANTTFDAALLGFDPDSDDVLDSSSRMGSLSPSAIWVCPEVYAETMEPESDQDVWANRMQSGGVDGGSRSDEFAELRLSFANIDAARTHARFNEADPNAAFSTCLARLKRGRHFQLHLVDLSGGQTAFAFDATSEYGDGWHLSKETAEAKFAPRRESNAVPLYAWDLRLWGRVS